MTHGDLYTYFAAAVSVATERLLPHMGKDEGHNLLVEAGQNLGILAYKLGLSYECLERGFDNAGLPNDRRVIRITALEVYLVLEGNDEPRLG